MQQSHGLFAIAKLLVKTCIVNWPDVERLNIEVGVQGANNFNHCGTVMPATLMTRKTPTG